VLDHRAGTASGWAADTDVGRGANANTCSTCQRPELMCITVVKGCDNEAVTSSQPLFDRDRSCLVVIDVQQYFLDKLPVEQPERLVGRIAWLMRVARALDIPIVATAEDIATDGPLVDTIARELPDNAQVHDKILFGLAGQQSILDDIRATDRDEFVLVGMETDVCVAHSAIGLLDLGYRVAVLDDATDSPPPNHESGIERLRAAGATITSVKGIYYEWVRDLATMHRVRGQLGEHLPDGLTL